MHTSFNCQIQFFSHVCTSSVSCSQCPWEVSVKINSAFSGGCVDIRSLYPANKSFISVIAHNGVALLLGITRMQDFFSPALKMLLRERLFTHIPTCWDFTIWKLFVRVYFCMLKRWITYTHKQASKQTNRNKKTHSCVFFSTHII